MAIKRLQNKQYNILYNQKYVDRGRFRACILTKKDLYDSLRSILDSSDLAVFRLELVAADHLYVSLAYKAHDRSTSREEGQYSPVFIAVKKTNLLAK